MLELHGKFGTAKVFTDVVDNESISQVINLLNQPYIEGSKVRMMPDIHAGAGCTIGTTMTIKDKICPNLVGVDIGCGMETIRIKETHIEPQKLDKVIRAGVPSGFEIRTEAHRYASSIDLSELYCAKMVSVIVHCVILKGLNVRWVHLVAGTILSKPTKMTMGISTSWFIPVADTLVWRLLTSIRKLRSRR